jgi:eukaryotic-like serine/threonine-protein kinase
MTGSEVTPSFLHGEPVAAKRKGEVTPGTTAGAYVIGAFIARGGCGSVYAARHRDHGRLAAVKILHPSLAVLPKMVERFEREVTLLNLLRHPNIIEVYDVGALPDGRPYYAMEHLVGRTVAALLDEGGRLSPAEAVEILAPVCAALEAAHAAGVIHRDVKASNIMVGGDGAPVVKLLDFGIAKLVNPTLEGGPRGLTSEGRQVGTLTIMAPEQLLNEKITHRVDIYALGILLFRMLTGRLPFDGRDPITLVQQHLEEPAPRPSQRAPLPPALDTIVLRCLEKQPDRRYDSVKDFLAALRGAASEEFSSRRRDSAPHAASRGFAIYADIRVHDAGDEIEEILSDDIGFILDLVEETLRAEGFTLVSATGSQVLAVRLLSADPRRCKAERAKAIDLAASLRRRIDQRPGADARVHVNLCAHVAPVITRPVSGARVEVSGGELARTDQWGPEVDVVGLAATREAVDGLRDLDVWDGPEGLLRVARRLTAPQR